MTQKDFVVSADGHLLEPIDLFKTRLPKHLRDRGVWEEDFEIEPLVEGGARIFRRLHTPGYEGWTISRYRQTGGRMPEGDPEHILEDMDLDGVDVQVMHPNLSLFGLYSDDHELSMAHARVYNDYVIERFSPYFSRLAPDRARADHRHRRRRRRDRAGRRRRVPRDPPAGDPAEAVLLARLRPGVGGGAGQRRARVHPHPDRWREGQRPGVHDAQGRHGVGGAGQPADDREVGLEADDHAVRLQHDRPAADHLRAHRRRRSRALPRPPLRADRVQRALARVAGGLHGQVLGHRDRPGRRLVARVLGRHPPRRRPAEHGAAVPPEREVAVPADAERVRAAPVPRVLPGRPRGHRLPAHHRPVDASCGATTTRTPKAPSAAAGS